IRIGFFFEHFMEMGELSDFLRPACLFGMVFYHGADGFTTSNGFVIKTMQIPVFSRIRHGNDLDIVKRKQTSYIDLSLSSCSDQGHIDFVTGRCITPAPQYISWNYHKASCARG